MTGYLGLGSNEGDRLASLRAARAALEQHGVEVTASSSVYETAPQGEVRIVVTEERRGRQLTTYSARLEQHGRICILALAALSRDFPSSLNYDATMPDVAHATPDMKVTPADRIEPTTHADQDLPCDASFAADIAPPAICRICSPAFVNWLFRNSDWMRMASWISVA